MEKEPSTPARSKVEEATVEPQPKPNFKPELLSASPDRKLTNEDVLLSKDTDPEDKAHVTPSRQTSSKFLSLPRVTTFSPLKPEFGSPLTSPTKKTDITDLLSSATAIPSEFPLVTPLSVEVLEEERDSVTALGTGLNSLTKINAVERKKIEREERERKERLEEEEEKEKERKRLEELREIESKEKAEEERKQADRASLRQRLAAVASATATPPAPASEKKAPNTSNSPNPSPTVEKTEYSSDSGISSAVGLPDIDEVTSPIADVVAISDSKESLVNTKPSSVSISFTDSTTRKFTRPRVSFVEGSSPRNNDLQSLTIDTSSNNSYSVLHETKPFSPDTICEPLSAISMKSTESPTPINQIVKAVARTDEIEGHVPEANPLSSPEPLGFTEGIIHHGAVKVKRKKKGQERKIKDTTIMEL